MTLKSRDTEFDLLLFLFRLKVDIIDLKSWSIEDANKGSLLSLTNRSIKSLEHFPHDMLDLVPLIFVYWVWVSYYDGASFLQNQESLNQPPNFKSWFESQPEYIIQFSVALCLCVRLPLEYKALFQTLLKISSAHDHLQASFFPSINPLSRFGYHLKDIDIIYTLLLIVRVIYLYKVCS